MTTTTILIVLLVLIVLGGGGWYGHRRWGPAGGSVSLLGLILLAVLVIWLLGGLQ